ncbi:MAG TPA: hypothetical protein VHR66_09485 [Gemmataceae bacterium]|jgi:hypothetical protein|nr:hypothetical protein [Gemmataceae bacterium]
MAGTIHPDGSDAATYRGLPAIYEFVNADGKQRHYNCGQAAACTLFTFREGNPPVDPETACTLMTAVEEAHPPDNLFGWFGTSRRRVERICLSRGIELDEIEGEEELRSALSAGRPVAMMVELPGREVLGIDMPAGHWMVAYGFDDQQIFLSNYHAPAMPWDEFRKAWNGLVPRLISMRNQGLVARPTG